VAAADPLAKRSRITTLALVLVVALSAPGGASVSADEEPETERYIVRYSDDVDASTEAETLEASHPEIEIEHVYNNVFEGFAAALPEDEVERLRDDPRVVSVEEDIELSVFSDATTQMSPPWGLDRTDQRYRPLSNTYTYRSTGTGVTAYVVDTGIRASHTEFSGRVAAGFTAIADGRGTSDCNGHGTHVAGTLGGSTYGVAKAVTLVPVRVLDCSGFGDLSDAIAGLNWIIGHQPGDVPAVVNISLGGGPSSALDAAVQAVVDAGSPVVVAAGNDGQRACDVSPARLPAAVTVAATDSTDHSPNWSNYGSCLDLFAPGVSILSAWRTSNTATATLDGTSMAAPHVAGFAATLLAAQPDLTPSEVATWITSYSTTKVVTNAGSGSPNRLLYAPPTAVPELHRPTALKATPAFDSVTGAAPKPRATVSWTNPIEPDVAAIDVRWDDGTGWKTRRVGVVTSTSFTGLKQSQAHRFAVRAVRTGGGVSAWAPSVRLTGSTLTSAVSTSKVTYGASTTVSGKLTRAGTTTALNGRSVRVQMRTRQADGTWSSWSNVSSVTTNSSGNYSLTHKTPRNAQYRTVFTGSGTDLGSVSPNRSVSVAPKVTSSLSTTSMTLGKTAKLTGTVSPNLSGRTATLQRRRSDGTWANVTSQKLSSTSTYSFSIKPTKKGTFTYRVVVPAAAPYATGVSPARSLKAT
jgi:subtilisin family serine protease